MFKKHHNLRYVLSRFRQFIYEKKNPSAPWLTQQSVSLLDNLIRKEDYGCEFGSGRSTIWLANRCSNLISIEHDKSWYDLIQSKIQSRPNVLYYHKSLDKISLVESPYLDVISDIKDNSIDFVLNDGKLRDWVALKMINKLKLGGLLIIDNAERYIPNTFEVPESIGQKRPTVNWERFLELTLNWRRIWTCNGITCTLIMFKS